MTTSTPIDITSMQFKWDMHLISWFHNHPDLKMYHCTADFKSKYGVSPNAYDKETRTVDISARSLRTPIDYHQASVTVAVFMNTYLPKLNKILWKTKPTDAFDIACKLKNYDLEAYKRHKDFNEIYTSKQRYRVATAEQILSEKHWESCKKGYMGVRKHGYK